MLVWLISFVVFKSHAYKFYHVALKLTSVYLEGSHLFSSIVTVVCKMSKSHATTNQTIEGSLRIRTPNWTDTLDLVMLVLMRQVNDEENYQNGTFSKDIWRRMTMAFNQQTNKNFNQQTNKNFTYTNLKNRLKVLKKNFNLYYTLANRSGWGWDTVLKVPTPGDQQMWDEVIAVSTL